jgi:hypothetical protein
MEIWLFFSQEIARFVCQYTEDNHYIQDMPAVTVLQYFHNFRDIDFTAHPVELIDK